MTIPRSLRWFPPRSVHTITMVYIANVGSTAPPVQRQNRSYGMAMCRCAPYLYKIPIMQSFAWSVSRGLPLQLCSTIIQRYVPIGGLELGYIVWEWPIWGRASENWKLCVGSRCWRCVIFGSGSDRDSSQLQASYLSSVPIQ
jgi:hypothetical protein